MNEEFWREDLQSAIQNLTQAASDNLSSEIVQDAFIKRFELAYELSWKWLQARLHSEGIIARSPRKVFKESIKLGLIENVFLWLEMIETRNILVHTYNAVKARLLVSKIKTNYLPLLELLFNNNPDYRYTLNRKSITSPS